MEQPHDQQAPEAVHHQVAKAGYGRHDGTSAQDRCVSMQTISGMTNRGTGKNTDRGGSTEDDPDLFCVQAPVPGAKLAGRVTARQMPHRANRRRPRIRAVWAACGA